MGWPQGLASPCACIWALVARIAVVCCADLCGSLLWSPYWQFAYSVELCGSLFWSPFLPILHPAFPTPHTKWFMVQVLGKVSFSTEVAGASWWLLAGLVPTHRVAMEPVSGNQLTGSVPGIYTGPLPTLDGTSSQAHQLVMSLIAINVKLNL